MLSVVAWAVVAWAVVARAVVARAEVRAELFDFEECEPVDDRAQNLPRDSRIEPRLLGQAADTVEHALLARPVDYRHVTGPFVVDYLPDEAGPFGQQRD